MKQNPRPRLISPKISSKKSRLATLVLSLALLAGLILAFNKRPQAPLQEALPEQQQTHSTEPKQNNQTSIDIAMVGDMLPHETVTKAAKTDSGYDYLSLISPELQKSFKKAELRFCNQEAPSAASLGVRGYPAFNAPAQFPKDLSKFGCNIISTGNNHASDAGQAGINGTLEEWDQLQPLATSGSARNQEEAAKLKIFEKDGIKIGFVAFSEISNSAPPNSYSLNRLSNSEFVRTQVQNLKSQTDLVIVSAHWGTEDSHVVNSSQKKYAQQLADLGADIIIGSGPHVWQPYVELNGSAGNKTQVWYSIGNGLNSQTKADQLFSAVALLKITKLNDGKIQIDSPRVLPTYMHYVWGNGVGLSNSQLLARKDLKWSALSESSVSNLLTQRNDFKTTVEDQKAKLKSYLNNDSVQILETY